MRLSEVEAAFEPSNPRRHDVAAIAASIRERGFNAPPMLNEKTGRLVYGHGRTKALRKLHDADPDKTPLRIDRSEDGEWCLPVIRGVSFRSKAEAEEYLLADNRLTELGGWDPEPTAKILERIRARGRLAGTGFTSKQVERLLFSVRKSIDVRDPEPGDLPAKPVTTEGDRWVLGDHVLICGDMARGDVARSAVGDQAVDVVWIDPPYGVGYESPGRRARPETQHKPISGDDAGSDALKEALPYLLEISKKGAPWYVCGPTGVDAAKAILALSSVGVFRQTIAWTKDSFVVGRSHFHARHESIFYGWRPGASCIHPPPSRKIDDVWSFDRPKRSKEHPTMKPVALPARAIELSSKRGDLVFDGFGGAGSTLLAAEQMERRAAIVEISPAYCDVIIGRWEDLTGKKATRAT